MLSKVAIKAMPLALAEFFHKNHPRFTSVDYDMHIEIGPKRSQGHYVTCSYSLGETESTSSIKPRLCSSFACVIGHKKEVLVSFR
jgi:hypothetical protein